MDANISILHIDKVDLMVAKHMDLYLKMFLLSSLSNIWHKMCL